VIQSKISKVKNLVFEPRWHGLRNRGATDRSLSFAMFRAALLRYLAALAGLLAASLAAVPALALSRIKDLAVVEGVRQNQLVGYGLVVGLNGTGDTLNNAPSPSSPFRPCWSD
jgi:hypothetical protein